MTSRASTPLTLDTPIADLPGVGPKRAAGFAKLELITCRDLLFHLPLRQAHFGPAVPVAELVPGELAHVRGVVTDVRKVLRGKPRAELAIDDGQDSVRVVFFNMAFMADRFRPGDRVAVLGKVSAGPYGFQFVNPRLFNVDRAAQPATQETIYPAGADLPSAAIAKAVQVVLDPLLPCLADPLPADIGERLKLPGLSAALRTMHRSVDEAAIAAARGRLAFEELFAFQTATAILRKRRASTAKAHRLSVVPYIDQRIRARFPFELTTSQNAVITELAADLARPAPMNRLLQGDVGSGKTVIALYACLVAVAYRKQAAILAPTELLAEQHARNLTQYLAGSQVRVELLTGSAPTGQAEAIVAGLGDGSVHLAIGTHALLQDRVQFSDLAVVVIDEQHKFGVEQRAKLAAGQQRDGFLPHTLVMTATPIPRTLAMTLFGELDVSTMPEKPPGRSAIRTTLLLEGQRADAYALINRHVAAGEQAYIVCPAVEPTDSGLRSAVGEARRLQRDIFAGLNVGLVHGQMSAAERDRAMADFRAARTHVLVGTTVVEVGVDVPNATVMLIENAERFGLSQLHQLRGRVGRGSKPGICLLMHAGQSVVSRERLSVLLRSEDGFEIAEEDLRLRGAGHMFGTQQSGLPPFRVADLAEDRALLEQARDLAREWVDEHLSHTRLRFDGDDAAAQRWMRRVHEQFGKHLELGEVG